MSFYMPTVNLTKLLKTERINMRPLLDCKGRLFECPPFNTPRVSKILHHVILKELYNDQRWTVPVHWAWGMPHISDLYTSDLSEEMEYSTRKARRFIRKGVFESPQPYQVDFQVYRVTRPDGTTFDMESKHK